MKPNNYDILVTQYIESIIGQEFDWSKNHCVYIALSARDAIYGTNSVEECKEKYNFDDEEGAKKHCENQDVLKGLTEDYGYSEVAKIHSGDVLYCQKDGWECVHVYSGGNFVGCEIGGKVSLIPPRTLYKYLNLNSTEYKLLSCHQ